MVFARRLVVVLVAVLLVPLLVGWYVVARFFLFTDAQRSTLALSVAASIIGTAAFTAFAVWRLTAPIELALNDGAPRDEVLRGRAITSALRLPGRLAAALVGLSTALVVAVAILELRQGLARPNE